MNNLMVFLLVFLIVGALLSMFVVGKLFLTTAFLGVARDFNLDFDPDGRSMDEHLPVLRGSVGLNRGVGRFLVSGLSVSRVLSTLKSRGRLSVFLLRIVRQEQTARRKSFTFVYRLAGIYSFSGGSLPSAFLTPDFPFLRLPQTQYPVPGLLNYHCESAGEAETFAELLTPEMIRVLEDERLSLEIHGNDVLMYQQKFGLFHIFGVRRFWQTVDILASELDKRPFLPKW